MTVKLPFLASLLLAEICMSSDMFAAAKPPVRWEKPESAQELSDSRYLIEGHVISLRGRVDGNWNRGAPITVEFANAIDENAQPMRYAAIVGEDASFNVACSPPPGTYTVRAIMPSGDQSEAITLLHGQKMQVSVKEPFKPDPLRRGDAEVDTAPLIPNDRKAVIIVDVPADIGEINIAVTRKGEAPDEPRIIPVKGRKNECPIDLKVANNVQPVDLEVVVAWRATRDKDFPPGEKLEIEANPLLLAFKVTGGYRQERSAASNFTFEPKPLFDAGSDTAPATEIPTTDPLLKIEGRLGLGLQSVQSLDVVVTAKEEQIREGLKKAEMEASEKITLTVQKDGTFDSEQDSKKTGKPVMLFPGKNTVIVSTSVNGQKVELEQLSVNSAPPDDAELWAWLHWTGDADVDLHVTPVRSKNVRSRTKEDIFWKNPEIRGIPARMLCWGSFSGTPEVFFVEKNSADVSGYEFFAKPDEGQTQGRIPQGGKLEPARLLFVLWTKETKTYRTEPGIMTFDNFPKEIPKVTFMN